MSTRHSGLFIRAGLAAIALGVIAVSIGVAMALEEEG
jgi:hypothetical protein